MPKTSGWQKAVVHAQNIQMTKSCHPCPKHPHDKKLSFMPKTSGWQKAVSHAATVLLP